MFGLPNPAGIPNQQPRRDPDDGGLLTDLSFLEPGQPWPPKVERARLDRYRDNRWLWKGRHELVFNDWQRLLRADQLAVLEFVFNLPKRLSTLWADLLLGEPPGVQAGDDGSPEQQLVDDLITRNMLATTAYEVMIDTSRYGDGLFKLRLEDGKTVIEGQPPAFWFPIASRDNVRDIQQHVLAWTFDVTEKDWNGQEQKRCYLRVEIHTKGQIENHAYLLEQVMKGHEIKREVPLEHIAPDRLPIEETGVDDFLVIPVAGLRTTDEYYGQDDYTDLATLLLEIETRVGQISRILDKHADPSMYGPNEVLQIDPNTGERVFVGGGHFYPVNEGENAPGYVVWDGQLAAAFTELEKLIELFYIVSETSPAAFGQMNAGLAVSGTALRRLMMAPLAKVNRIRLRLDPALKRLITTAIALEGGTPPASVQIHWRDGLPEDPVEMANIEATRKQAGNTSVYSSIKRLDGGTDAEIQNEIDRIHEDAANATATNPFMPPLRMRMPPGGQGIGSNNDQRGGPDQTKGNASQA
jgi:hypothetical protein